MIPSRLRDARTQRGLTQEQLALDVGIHPRMLPRYEGGVCAPQLEGAVRIAKRLRVSLDWLVGLAACGECGETDGAEEITKQGGEVVRTCEHCRREVRAA